MVFGSSNLGVMRWLEKLRDPLAVQAQEPKTRVVPSGTLLVTLDPAIEFTDELAESPTWRASCRCLPPSLLRDTLSSRIVGKGSTSSGTLWCKEHKDLDRFRPLECNTQRPVWWFVLP